MYLKGSKWSMNRRRQHFNWFRIILICLFIAAGLYLDKYVIPTQPSPFEPTATATRPPEAYVTEAEGLFRQGKLLQSIQAYQQAVAVEPDDPTVYVALARVQVFAGEYQGAQTSAENALLLNPNNSMAHAVRAWALDFESNYLEAEASIKRALELDSKNAVAHAYYVEILVDEYTSGTGGFDNVQKAIDESKTAQALAPDSLETHRARGYVLEATANYEEAVREYQAAIAINDKISDLHLALGRNYSALGIYDQAVQEYTNANALNPSDPTPDYLISRTYATVGEFAKAMQYAETAVKDDPGSPRYHGNLGVMYYHNALISDAVRELALAVAGGTTEDGQKVEPIELAPNSPRIAEIYFTYALALAKVGRCGETLQIAQIVQARIPDDALSVDNVNEAIRACQQNLASSGTSLSGFGLTATPSLEAIGVTPTP
jgi:tetratricopeptide (TPR) repeat protein